MISKFGSPTHSNRPGQNATLFAFFFIMKPNTKKKFNNRTTVDIL